jgi:hypothetical protein
MLRQRLLEQQREAEERERREERQRVDGCKEVIQFFANKLGYVAREVMTRDEVWSRIQNGISPEDLATQLMDRIEAVDGIILGNQPAGEANFPVALTQKYRDRHLYIVGKSGSGKTNFIRTLIYQDLQAGSGIGVIAPEQEMITEEILPFVPPDRLEDVIYVDPSDSDNHIGFNPLQLDPGEDLDLKVDETMTVLERSLGELPGSRMSEILRQVLYALIERSGSTLLDIEPLLNRSDPAFRYQVIREIKDERTVHFFLNIYPQLPKDAHLPITNRLGRLIRPKPVRNIICQQYGSLNFRHAMDKGKILMFNLSDGILGAASSQLLGQLVVAKFQLAAMSRADIPKKVRRPFYLYLDEFQTFTGVASASYERLLSRARKYRLGLILAHQQTGQLPTSLLKEIFGNVSTMIAFNVSRDDAVRLSREFITEYNGEVVQVPPEELLSLRIGETFCKIGRSCFFMRTNLAPEVHDEQWALKVAEISKQLYGSKQMTIESNKVASDHSMDKSIDLDSLDPSQVF